MHLLLRVALAIEAAGVVNACWPLAWGVQSVFKIPDDPDLPALQNAAEAAGNGAAASRSAFPAAWAAQDSPAPLEGLLAPPAVQLHPKSATIL